MAVEANRRETEKQGGLGLEYLFPFGLARNRGGCFGCRVRSRFTEHHHVALLDNSQTAAARETAPLNERDHRTVWTLVYLKIGDLGHFLDFVADSERFVKGHARSADAPARQDRKSTRLNSSHPSISY